MSIGLDVMKADEIHPRFQVRVRDHEYLCSLITREEICKTERDREPEAITKEEIDALRAKVYATAEEEGEHVDILYENSEKKVGAPFQSPALDSCAGPTTSFSDVYTIEAYAILGDL